MLKTTQNNRLSDTERYPIAKQGQYKFDDIPLDDPRIYSLFARGSTLGIFQLEKKLGQDWAKQSRPQNLEELAILISILRPGPLESGMSEQYVKRKNGDEETVYFHPALEPILKDTYGCLIYQEQSLRIAMEIAGMTESEADVLRKGLGKKLPEIIAKCKIEFVSKAEAKGIVSKAEAEEIFGWIEKGQRYLFNKSHAICYALNGYYTAYQKVHFPTEFYTAWLTYSDWKPDPKEEIYNLVQDAKLHNVQVLQPDVRHKNIDFKIVENKKIVFGLSHIRGVGSSAIKVLEGMGDKLETFKGLLSCTKKLRRNVAEALIKSGACDCYNLPRIEMVKYIHVLFGRSEKDTDDTKPELKPLSPNEFKYVLDKLDKLSVEEALEGLIKDKIPIPRRMPTIQAKLDYLKIKQAESNRNKAIWEKLYLGITLSCSAADDVVKTERNIKSCKEAYKSPPKTKCNLHCVLDKIQMKKTGDKSKTPGRDYCYLTLSDNSLAIQAVLWPDDYEKHKEILFEGDVYSVYGVKDCWNGRDNFIIRNMECIG
jgi:DNA polymerase III alpha subunit